MKIKLRLFTASILALALISLIGDSGTAADAPAKPVLKITPGKVIIPFDKMQRPWGELISIDLQTRTGKFRRENTDEVITFTVMPYAELLHHATHGDLQDFRIGERAIFRLHENEKGEWVFLTYIQDEMNMMNGHGEYFFVEEIDAKAGKISTTWAKGDLTFIREKGVVIETDKETRFWKAGQPAQFSDIKKGDKLRTKTHGIGKGKVESLNKFRTEQKEVHAQRILKEGAPGYVDEANGSKLILTLFNEGEDQVNLLKKGSLIKVASAGIDRKASAESIAGKVVSLIKTGKQTQVTLELEKQSDGFKPTSLARLWIASKVK
jgi:hypothetical protein